MDFVNIMSVIGSVSSIIALIYAFIIHSKVNEIKNNYIQDSNNIKASGNINGNHNTLAGRDIK